MIVIDYKDTRPIYEQIVDRFEALILKGVLPPDSRLPSVRSLAMELSINPNTIQKAYDRLEQNGFLYSVKGRGSFVSCPPTLIEKKKQELLEQLRALAEQAYALGVTRQELLAATEYQELTAERNALSANDLSACRSTQTGGDRA